MDNYPDNHASSARILILILLLAFLILPCMAGANSIAVHAAENIIDGSDKASAEENRSAAAVSNPPDINAAETQDNNVITLRFVIENKPVAGALFTCIRAGTFSDFPEVRKGTAEEVLKKIAAEEAKAEAATADSSEPAGAAGGMPTGTAGETDTAAGTPSGTAEGNGGTAGQSSSQAAGSRIRLTGKTDENGELQFFGLPEGVYVIEGEDVLFNNYIYTPQPFLMSARNPDTEEPVTAQIKYERTGRDTEKPTPKNTGQSTTAIGKKLPQTGLPWNRIRLLCAAGLLLITAGTALRTPNKEQSDKPAP